ncbi:recombinase family protein [Frisingicoccus sp.]|uniref:recombinase family protein n=1 Tax=Frisingicoccus sp. TaxID=1918627 RepID=UPI00386A21FA
MTVFEMNNAVDEALKGKMPKYAIYLRKSRADLEAEKLGEGETLARHKKILTELAARKGLYIEKIYQEIVSGETIKDRPEIQKLIEDCYAGKYKGILIVEVTRLSRGSQGDAQIIMDCLRYSNRNNGVLVITPTKTYDVAHNHDDSEYLEFELFMSRREYQMIKRRMDRGRLHAVIEGNYMGSYRPYGYDILKTKTGRTLVPNEEEAPIVKMIFEWTVKNHFTPGTIARKLTNMGVPTYTGEPEWSTATIKTILTNPTYIGKVKWNDRMQVKTMVNGELVTSRPRSNHTDHYMEYDGKHKKHALVDEETFKAAASRFHSDKTKSGLKLINPLAGILVCKNCQKMMAYQPNKNKTAAPRYLHKQSQLCKVKSVVASDVKNAVVHSLKLYIEDFELKVNNLPDVNENTILSQMEALQTELKKIEKKLAKLFDAWEDNKISDNEFVERKAVNNAKIESIKKQMDELEESIPEKEEYEEKILLLSDALDAILDDTLDADVINAYLKQIIDRIEFSRENKDEFILDIFLK